MEILAIAELSLYRQCSLDRKKGVRRDYDSVEEARFLGQSDT